MGMTDVTVVRVEGIAMGPEAKARGLEAALAEIDRLFLRAAA